MDERVSRRIERAHNQNERCEEASDYTTNAQVSHVPPRSICSSIVIGMLASFEFYFHESKLVVVGIDDVMGNAGGARVRNTRPQLGLAHARAVDQSQGAARQ